MIENMNYYLKILNDNKNVGINIMFEHKNFSKTG